MSAQPYRPVTKEDASILLAITIATIDNHIRNGLLPVPIAIGRTQYWHPNVFYGALDRILLPQSDAATVPAPPTPQHRHVTLKGPSSRSDVVSRSEDRDAAHLRKLNE
jgi:hypothetical protein